MERLLVMKFGGTSVADVDRIRHVVDRIRQRRQEGNSLVIVVSAMGDETDRLLELAGQISSNPNSRELDMLLTTGERITMALTSMALNDVGIPAISFTGSQSGIITDTQHNRAKIVTIQATRIETELQQGKVVVVAGFQGVSRTREVTTLGRGGSDTTAVALAGALKADRCEIYTDVDGVYAVDPRLRQTAEKIERISYEEMIELAGAGCHILEARSVIFAKKFTVPLWVGSSFNDAEGTLISEEFAVKPGHLTGISQNAKEAVISLIGLRNDPAKIRDIMISLAESNIAMEICYQQFDETGKENLSFAIPETDLTRAKTVLDAILTPDSVTEIVTWDSLARISIIGRGMKGVPGILVRLLGSLGERRIPVFIVTTSDLRISAFVPRTMSREAVNTIADAFNLA